MKKSPTPSTKLLKILVNCLILSISDDIAFNITGKEFINHPIKIIPKKSNILPKNPFVLL